MAVACSTMWRRLRFFLIGRVLPKRMVQGIMYLTQTKFLVAVVVVLWHGDEILLLRHSYRPRYPWGLLTGWVNAGESPEQAASREVFEETGLTISQFHYFYSGAAHRRHMEIGYWADVASQDQLPASADGEITELRWFAADALPDLLLPAQRPLIQAARRQSREFS